jgi:hypothetical protein
MGDVSDARSDRVRGLACALLVLIVLGCVPPKDRRPGLRLSGEVVSEPVADWSFSESVQEIFVETRTWYRIPHSVTTVCAVHGGSLYVPSLYRARGDFPQEKFWNRNIARDPRVRLKIGDKIYLGNAVLVTDALEAQQLSDAFARKYANWREMLAAPQSERPKIYYIRMEPRGA